MKYVVAIRDRKVNVDIREGLVMVEGREVPARLIRFPDSPAAILELEGQTFPLVLEPGSRGRWTVSSRGDRVELEVLDERIERARRSAGTAQAHSAPPVLTAPMPGLVIRVRVSPGEPVQPGSSLVVLEAMKMENELKAVAAAVVDRVLVEPGQPVEKGDVLVRFREPPRT